MVSSNPKVLLVPTAVLESQPPEFRAFVHRITETLHVGLSRSCPLSKFLNISAFNKPKSLSEAATRVLKNVSYFKMNYICIISLILGFSLLAHPFILLLLLSLAASWIFLYIFRPSDRPLIVSGRSFSRHEILGGLILSTIAVIFLTRVVFVLISALMIGLATVCLHSVFRSSNDLFLDEQDPAAIGLLSFIGVPKTSYVPSASSAPSAR